MRSCGLRVESTHPLHFVKKTALVFSQTHASIGTFNLSPPSSSYSKLSLEEMANNCEELPEECWELIFNFLDHPHHSYFESLSLVSKRFLSITNRLRFSLTITHATIILHATLSKLYKRFHHLKTLDLSQSHGQLDNIVTEIANSSLLNLEALDISNHKTIPGKSLKELGLKMKNFKVLRCANMFKLCDGDLIAISNYLPGLEELDLSYPTNNFTSPDYVTDNGVEALCSNLKSLVKLNISGNHFITDKSLVVISLNCLYLSEIAVLDCSFLTQNGVQFMMCNSPRLSVVSVNGIRSPFRSSPLVDSISYGRALSSLDFSDSVISDEFLYAIAKACLPLKRLSLSRSTYFTISGVSMILYTYQSLEYLALVSVQFLTDQSVNDLSQFLRCVVSIKLNLCSSLTTLTLFTLAKNCPLLKDVEMDRTNVGKGECFMDFVRNAHIRSLKLSKNSHMSDECLRNIALVCPNLELLDLSSCLGITEHGIVEILEKCSEIRQLQINDCGGIKNLGTEVEFLKLEVLLAARSGLVMIGKGCCGLLKLDLEGCCVVTTTMVKEVVRNCERLREINLKGCGDVNPLISDWIVFTRPSLKKIIPPCYYATTKKQRNFLLRHGCLICEDY